MRQVFAASIIGLLALSCIGTASAESKDDIRHRCFSGQQVSLSGVFKIESEYGPPNWGEDPKHDSKWTLFYLKVSDATANNIRGVLKGCFDKSDDLTKVQLWTPTGQLKLSKYKTYQDTHVKVTGSLIAALGAPAQILPTQLELARLSRTDQPHSPTLMEPSSNEVVVSLYQAFSWEAFSDASDKKGLLEQPLNVLEKYFTSALSNAIVADRRCAERTKEICKLDFLPQWGTQDPHSTTFSVNATDNPDIVLVHIQIVGQNEPTTLRYFMKQTPVGWRIYDIRSAQWSLSKILGTNGQ